jgi:hypothetical protein
MIRSAYKPLKQIDALSARQSNPEILSPVPSSPFYLPNIPAPDFCILLPGS